MTKTLTFLFTDIEGSTRLWEKHPDTMGRALERHDEIMRGAIQAHKGIVFKTIGDAFCAAFETPKEALAAVLQAQLALHKEAWPDKIEIKVRMGLHTGPCEERDGDYFGPPLNRTARLMGTAHGAQSILSEATRNLVQTDLPKGASLLSLGRHRLKDLQEAEPIYQLRHNDLTSTFPPLKSLDNPNLPNNLPQQVSSFIGRQEQLEEVKEQLTKTRLLTLTGSGGCGKTRLAVQMAAELLDSHRDGVWLVELAPITDGTIVAHAVAHVLSVKEKHGSPYEYTLVNAIRNRQLLLVVDNCEHLVSACAFLFETILKNCPYITVIASSREPINIAGERTYRVPSLSMPNRGARITKEDLLTYEALRLFVERAASVDPNFAVTDDNVMDVVNLCRHLDGIPFAIELAAARVRSLSVTDINNKLDDRFRLLTGGSRTALPRQQTLRAMIDWSYDLLTEPERLLLCRLSVFAGSYPLEAAEAVAEGDGIEDWEILDLLTSLTDKSLVSVEPQDGTTRYRMLETVREYGRAKLTESGQHAVYAKRHAEQYVKSADASLTKMRTREESAALRRLEHDLDDLRSAASWAKSESENQLYAQLGLALGRILLRRGFLPEAVAHVQGALDALQADESALYADLLQERAGLHLDYEEPNEAHRLAALAQPIYEKLGDAAGQAKAENVLGQAAMLDGSYDDARSRLKAALAHYEESGDKIGAAIVLNNLGLVERRDITNSAPRDQRLDIASNYLQQALAIRRQLDDRRGLAETLNNLGVVAHELNDLQSAWNYYAEALQYEREVQNAQGAALMLANLGEVAEHQGDIGRALKLYAASEVSLAEIQSPRLALVAAMTLRVSPDPAAADAARAEARRLNSFERGSAILAD